MSTVLLCCTTLRTGTGTTAAVSAAFGGLLHYSTAAAGRPFLDFLGYFQQNEQSPAVPVPYFFYSLL